MAETAMWRDVRPGDVLDVRGTRWTVVARNGAELTLKSQSGALRSGRPDPRGAVTVVERAPRDEATEAAIAALGPLKPEPVCALWLGAANRYCGSSNGVRLYLQGYRCAAHAPVAVRCAKCRQPLSGDPGQRCLTCGTKITKAGAKR